MSAYEEQRASRIEENRRFLEQLGLTESIVPPSAKKKTGGSKTGTDPKSDDAEWTPPPPPPRPLRRSTRSTGSHNINFAELEKGWAEHLWKVGRRSYAPTKNQSNNSRSRSLGLRRANPGRRVVHGRVYDSELGSTCHQCRQKTIDPKVQCTNVIKTPTGKRLCNIMFDARCLTLRYGQTLEEALAAPEWICPKCRGICNCSFCRRKEGKRPTGILIHHAQKTGYESVHELLAEHEGNGDGEQAEGLATIINRYSKKRKRSSTDKERRGSSSDDFEETRGAEENENVKEKFAKRPRRRSAEVAASVIPYFESEDEEEEDGEATPEEEEEKMAKRRRAAGVGVSVFQYFDSEEEEEEEEEEEKKEQKPNKKTKQGVKAKGEAKQKEEGEEEEREYVVEKILSKRNKGRKVEYLIKWEGYNDSCNSWEPKANLFCEQLLRDFEAAAASSSNSTTPKRVPKRRKSKGKSDK
ncbi:Cell division cycle-associated 7-like protein [Balamuthia mandrillaris]